MPYRTQDNPTKKEIKMTTQTMTAEEAYVIARNDPVRRIIDKKIIEEAISSDLNYIVMYARDVIGGRWSEGEEAILTKNWTGEGRRSKYIREYATYVIKDRWIAAEETLFQDASLEIRRESLKPARLCDYDAHRPQCDTPLAVRELAEYYGDLICGYEKNVRRHSQGFFKESWMEEKSYGTQKRNRWIEYEHILFEINDTFENNLYLDALKYSKHRDCFLLAHEAKKCYDHAKNVVKGRWVEGEKIIKKHEYWWKKYQDFLSKSQK